MNTEAASYYVSDDNSDRQGNAVGNLQTSAFGKEGSNEREDLQLTETLNQQSVAIISTDLSGAQQLNWSDRQSGIDVIEEIKLNNVGSDHNQNKTIGSTVDGLDSLRPTDSSGTFSASEPVVTELVNGEPVKKEIEEHEDKFDNTMSNISHFKGQLSEDISAHEKLTKASDKMTENGRISVHSLGGITNTVELENLFVDPKTYSQLNGKLPLLAVKMKKCGSDLTVRCRIDKGGIVSVRRKIGRPRKLKEAQVIRVKRRVGRPRKTGQSNSNTASGNSEVNPQNILAQRSSNRPPCPKRKQDTFLDSMSRPPPVARKMASLSSDILSKNKALYTRLRKRRVKVALKKGRKKHQRHEMNKFQTLDNNRKRTTKLMKNVSLRRKSHSKQILSCSSETSDTESPGATGKSFAGRNKQDAMPHWNLDRLKMRKPVHILRSLDRGIKLRSKDKLTHNDHQKDTVKRTRKKTSKTMKKEKPPPESPPLNPTQPVLELDCDVAGYDMDNIFGEDMAEVEPDFQPTPKKNKWGEAKRKYLSKMVPVIKPGASVSLLCSRALDNDICSRTHACCIKNATKKRNQATQWEEPSEWFGLPASGLYYEHKDPQITGQSKQKYGTKHRPKTKSTARKSTMPKKTVQREEQKSLLSASENSSQLGKNIPDIGPQQPPSFEQEVIPLGPHQDVPPSVYQSIQNLCSQKTHLVKQNIPSSSHRTLPAQATQAILSLMQKYVSSSQQSNYSPQTSQNQITTASADSQNPQNQNTATVPAQNTAQPVHLITSMPAIDSHHESELSAVCGQLSKTSLKQTHIASPVHQNMAQSAQPNVSSASQPPFMHQNFMQVNPVLSANQIAPSVQGFIPTNIPSSLHGSESSVRQVPSATIMGPVVFITSSAIGQITNSPHVNPTLVHPLEHKKPIRQTSVKRKKSFFSDQQSNQAPEKKISKTQESSQSVSRNIHKLSLLPDTTSNSPLVSQTTHSSPSCQTANVQSLNVDHTSSASGVNSVPNMTTPIPITLSSGMPSVTPGQLAGIAEGTLTTVPPQTHQVLKAYLQRMAATNSQSQQQNINADPSETLSTLSTPNLWNT